MGRIPAALTRAEVRAADERACRVLGVPTACLMEHAGRGLADVTEGEIRRYGLVGAVVVAARGNNGGDGLVAARLLRVRGIPVRVLLATPSASFVEGSDPARNLAAARACGVPVGDASGPGALPALGAGLARDLLLVDAVLGTGLEGPVRGPLEAVLAWMASQGRPVVAADLPSGLDADTGALLGPVARCVATATFLAPKRGLLVGRGPEHAGRVTVCDIGVPLEAVLGGEAGASG
jgi:NAD(P)H-hydrate epimerase